MIEIGFVNALLASECQGETLSTYKLPGRESHLVAFRRTARHVIAVVPAVICSL